jgi:hypothetical protein
LKVPCGIPCVVGVVWVVVIKIVVETVVEAPISPVLALTPVNVLSVVAELGSIIALVATLPSIPVVVIDLGSECSLSAPANHALASPVGNVGTVSHNLSAVAGISIVSESAVLETSVDAAVHALLANVLVNNPVVLTNGVGNVAVVNAGSLGAHSESEQAYQAKGEGRVSCHIQYYIYLL